MEYRPNYNPIIEGLNHKFGCDGYYFAFDSKNPRRWRIVSTRRLIQPVSASDVGSFLLKNHIGDFEDCRLLIAICNNAFVGGHHIAVCGWKGIVPDASETWTIDAEHILPGLAFEFEGKPFNLSIPPICDDEVPEIDAAIDVIYETMYGKSQDIEYVTLMPDTDKVAPQDETTHLYKTAH